MVYKRFQDLELSALGLGAMRLPIIGGNLSDIDEEHSAKMVAYAMEHGVNYYDTAWGYHDGRSETVMGEVLSDYPRESFYLATKFPGYDLANFDNVSGIFEEQLRKCRVDHFDFYLFHNVCEKNIDQYLDPKYGVHEYLMEQKRSGRIRHLGFSCHGQPDVLRRFLEAYGSDLEFCQLQLNYLDWTFQNDIEKVDMLKEYGIPVWVMEPLRGGKLADMAPDDLARLQALRPNETAVGWAFRFLQSLPEVKVILSGMSNMEQLKENIAVFETDEPLDQNEMKTLLDIADRMLSKKTLPCTGCRYCAEYCPQQLDIPYLIKLYNEHNFSGGGFLAPMALSKLEKDQWPSACLHCQSCEAVCPQQIAISDAMADFAEKVKG